MSIQEHPMKILVVEDDFVSRVLIQKLLTRWGEVHIAVSGGEALRAFSSAFEAGEPYQLVCLDLMMPVMDGREVLVQIRAFEKSRGIHFPNGVKVIVTTALNDAGAVLFTFREGCEAYLVKPISREGLEAELRKLLLI